MTEPTVPTLPGWVLDAHIGSGGIAEVWRARPEGGGDAVALKVLREPNRSASHLARFLREGRLLQRMDHPALPRCMAVAQGEQPYLVLELLVGETLSARARREPLAPTRVSQIASDLLRVLGSLHDVGVVHRDVKPSNIFLTADDRVLLLDLGLAVDPNDPLTTTLGDVMGTYAYMAPEQIAGSEVDHRSDLYSLGVTLYTTIAGRRPFQAEGAAGYLRAHRSGQYTPLSELCPDAPARLLETISRLMARDPAARPPSTGVARALLTGASAPSGTLRPAPLIGRAAAMGAIEARLDTGGVVMLLGEIGAGVGRMALWALENGRDRGAETLAIRCRARDLPDAPLTQLRRDLRSLVGDFPESTSETARALEALSEEGPLLLLIEDIEHAAPEALQELRQALLAAPRATAVLTGIDAPDWLEGHRVRLRPLTLVETEHMVQSMLGTPSPPAGLSTRVHELSSGLPAIVALAVRELVGRRALHHRGIGEDGRAIWQLDRAIEIEPMRGLSRLFGSALQGLPPVSRQLLDVLAVTGSALPLQAALMLADADASGIDMGPLQKAHLTRLETRDDGEWITLRRPAVAALALRRVTLTRQTALHAKLAEWLAKQPQTPWTEASLRWHSAHGAPPDRCAEALMLLGESLVDRGHAHRALEVLERATQASGAHAHTTARIALARGDALAMTARGEEAISALAAALKLAEDVAAEELIIRALVAQAGVWLAMGDAPRAADFSEEALERLNDHPAPDVLGRALLVAAEAHRLAAHPDDAESLYERCLASQPTGGAWAARAHGGLGALYSEDGDLERAQSHFRKEASWLRARGEAIGLARNRYLSASIHRREGRVDLALAALHEAAEAARFGRIPHVRALVDIGIAATHIAIGDLIHGRSRLDAARAALDPEADRWIRVSYREVQARLRLLSGDRQAALAAYQAGEQEAARAGHVSHAAFFLGMVGVLTADPDAITRAIDVLGSVGDRRLAAQLLLQGATVGGDVEVLEVAEEETRACGDRFLLLDVLHASGSAAHQDEAKQIAEQVSAHLTRSQLEHFVRLPAVRWTGLASLMAHRKR